MAKVQIESEKFTLLGGFFDYEAIRDIHLA